MIGEARAEPQPRDRRGQVRFLLLSNGCLAAFALASIEVPTTNAPMLGAASLVLVDAMKPVNTAREPSRLLLLGTAVANVSPRRRSQ